MSLEDLDDSDIKTLRELLELSRRADPDRRRALCIEIDIDPAEFSAIGTISTHDFVVELIDLLQKRKLETAIYKLSQELQLTFQGSKYVSRLDAIVRKINNEHYVKLDNVITSTSSPIESLNFLNTEISIQGNYLHIFFKVRELFLRFLKSGSSIRKAFIISLIVTSGLVGVRFFAVLEWLELKTFDHLMQARLLEEKEDNRLVIVAIADRDILEQDKRREKGYGNSLRDPSLNKLLAILEQHKPRLIGLDLYRAFRADSAIPDLVNRLQQKNIVTVCKVPATDEEGNTIAPGVPPAPEIVSLENVREKVGFSDFVTDTDGHVRRHLMAQDIIPGTECRTKESFSLLLARRYLEQEQDNKKYKAIIREGENPRIGNFTFPVVQSFTSGYQGIDSSGYQVLLNYRATISGKIAKVLTLEDVFNNKFDGEEINDKIVLVGSYAYQEGPRDEWSTPYGTMNGVTVHAHMVSQILSTVLDGRSLLRVWSQGIEIIWIGVWSFFGGFLVCYWRSLKTIGLVITASILVLYIICLMSLTFASLWIPFIPAGIAFTITSSGLIFIRYLSRKHT
ncbi:CHASE2 domain-containing protein [Scytonema sp. NUACC26]|uniref:CHASE2 domain-containing protein n=1 Tax=Scytonema sp. NUACC26 TaxID=3140176 RepID=UPI0034DC1754